MITVAVVARSPTARSRLAALVAAQPGLRLACPARPMVTVEEIATSTGVDADVLVIDVGRRPAGSALRALAQAPHLPPVVLLAGDTSPAATARLLRLGVRALLPPDASTGEIAAGIAAAAAGLVALHPSAVPTSVTEPTSSRRARDEAGVDQLTPRELEILEMMAEGLGNRAIAQRLGISAHTVKFHIAAILGKLDARSRTAAVTAGLRRGWLMV